MIHLVRAHNGIETFRQFLDSYRENPGGIDHDLLIVFKGFELLSSKEEYLKLLSPFRHLSMEVSDAGVDITAYSAALKVYSKRYRYFCMLNSHSVILDRDWLKKLHNQISKQDVGLVGATGSWESQRGIGVPAWKVPLAVAIEHFKNHPLTWDLMRVFSSVYAIWHTSYIRFSFDKFPNYHLRSNAFMIDGALVNVLVGQDIKTKSEAHRFESGKNGLTKQVFKTGKKVLVVDKNGVGFEKESWRESRTFRYSEQENLLVADNQTRDYQHSTPERRALLRSITWGGISSEKHQ